MDQDVAIAELKRVASELKTTFLSRSLFAAHANISAATIEATFGSWNEAIVAAGLVPLPQGGLPKSEQRRLERLGKYSGVSQIQGVTDDELLDDLWRLARELGRRPSGNQIGAKGRYGKDVYLKRWGTWAAAYEAAKSRAEGANR